jgi:dTDP-glucose 4,6-dehydratase
MNYLVTGGCGFIGSNYVRGLLSGRWGSTVGKVTVIDSLTYAGSLTNLAPVASDYRLHFIQQDIVTIGSVAEVLQGHDVIVHFAAESHVDRSISGSAEFVRTNVLGTHALLQVALDTGISTFIHVSTDEVYGSILNGSWDEQEPLLPNSPYAASKASSDLIARSFNITHGMDVRITRCSNNFGTYQYPEKVIPLFITNILEGKKVPLYGDGLNIRDWLHVDDHCRGIQLVLEKGRAGEIYNIGGGTELSNKELTMLIIELMGKDESIIQPVEDRKAHDRRYSVDIAKIHNELGYSPQETLRESLPNIIRWYTENEQWWRPLKYPSSL